MPDELVTALAEPLVDHHVHGCLAGPVTRGEFEILLNEGSPDPGGIPARWALKSVIIVGFMLLMLQGISQAIKHYYVARGWEEPEQRVKEIH